MKTVLMVAEKPSLAQSIAKILSKGAYEQQTKQNIQVLEFIDLLQDKQYVSNRRI